jgi:hypothetical protein
MENTIFLDAIDFLNKFVKIELRDSILGLKVVISALQIKMLCKFLAKLLTFCVYLTKKIFLALSLTFFSKLSKK